jgi:uncharacterized protein YegJ (DUF2314 family)
MTTAQKVILGTGVAAFVAVLTLFRRSPVPSEPVAAFPPPENPPPAPTPPAPAIEVSDDDPRMLAAVTEARRRWPEFLEAFNRRKPSQSFSVKMPFRDDPAGDAEFMWVEVISIDGNTIHGSLVNQPFYVRSLTMHDSVEVRLADLNDWIFTQDGQSIGGFTSEILDESSDEDQEN